MKVAIFQLHIFGVNTYVVYDPEAKEAAIIDPGITNSQELSALDNFLTKNNLRLTHIINTHLHIDHAIGNSTVAEKYKIPIWANKQDLPLGDRIKDQARMFGIMEDVKDPAVTGFLSAGETIKIGNGELKVIPVPGHSPGSIALYDKKDKFVIVGDALFKGSIGRTDLPGGDYETLINSIRKNLLTLPFDTTVFPGHGPSTTIGTESKSNPFLR